MRQGSGSPVLRQAAIRASCLAYQIWLARNARLFGERRMSLRFVVESACARAAELCHTSPVGGTLTARDIWGSHPASAVFCMVFFTWEPPSPSFLKVNFDGSVLDGGLRGGAGFVIRNPSARVVAAGGSQLFDTSVPCAELSAAWAGVRYARCVLRARSIILEGDSATVISWIQGGPRGGGCDHPLLRDIWAMARDGWAFQATHIYREGNGAADWVAAFVACHSGDTLWLGDGELPLALRVHMTHFEQHQMEESFPKEGKKKRKEKKREKIVHERCKTSKRHGFISKIDS
ncbi:uncharacterized protein LOC120113132 [Phoenix dactylifera]|uniref:Uncharacterized protein LOC120113132 n=1 Tax=Phoenix dactylifera TaxID=42345 RepID=A0A8B9B290_PHODC|nr:uncharacterized protein LOC120113132 [Phoenix dactylifera]